MLQAIATITIAFTHKKTRDELDAKIDGVSKNGTRFQVPPYMHANLQLSFLTDAFRALDALWTTNGRCVECIDGSASSLTAGFCDPTKQSPCGGGTKHRTPIDAYSYLGFPPEAKKVVTPIALHQLSSVRLLIEANPPELVLLPRLATILLLYAETACVRTHKQQLYQMAPDGKRAKAANAFHHLQYVTRFLMLATRLLETLLQQGERIYALELCKALLFFGQHIIRFEQCGDEMRLRARSPLDNARFVSALETLLGFSYLTTNEQRQNVSQLPSSNGPSSVEWGLRLALTAEEFYRSVAMLLLPDFQPLIYAPPI